jgi:hypothetical protein
MAPYGRDFFRGLCGLHVNQLSLLRGDEVVMTMLLHMR